MLNTLGLEDSWKSGITADCSCLCLGFSTGVGAVGVKETPLFFFAGRNISGAQGGCGRWACLISSETLRSRTEPFQICYPSATWILLEILTFGHPNNESQTAVHAQHWHKPAKIWNFCFDFKMLQHMCFIDFCNDLLFWGKSRLSQAWPGPTMQEPGGLPYPSQADLTSFFHQPTQVPLQALGISTGLGRQTVSYPSTWDTR